MTNTPLVLLDPGHGRNKSDKPGKNDPGACGWDKEEAHYAVLTAEICARILREKGVTTMLTRSDGPWGVHRENYNPVRPGTRDALSWRRDVIQQIGATHFVSLHWNGFGLQSAYGTCVCLRPNASAISARMARAVLGQLVGCLFHYDSAKQVQGWSPKNRGLLRMRLGVLANQIPSILVEPEFITNPVVNKLMGENDFIWTVAYGIASGIQQIL